jgi:mannose-1-phosphate guanylyltransferase/phosphomannomutase
MKQAIIIAGGYGTRMVKILKGKPKSFIKIGDKFLIEHQINLLHKFNFKNIIICSGYEHYQIKNFVQKKYKNILVIKDNKFNGTAGALINIKKKLKKNFLVMYGDIMINLDLNKFSNKFLNINNNFIGQILVHPTDHMFDSDLVEITKDNIVKKIRKYPHKLLDNFENLANSALFYFNKKILSYLNDLNKSKLDIVKDLLIIAIKKKRIYAYKSSEYIKDCGTPKRYDQIKNDYKKKIIQNNTIMKKQKAIFLDRDGTINYIRNNLYKPNQIKLYKNVGKAINKINHSGYKCIVITNQPVIAKNLCNLSTLKKIHNKIETLISKDNAYLDGIYFCPHHPDKGFKNEKKRLKVHCNCRKPKIALIKEAQKKFNLDLKKSWFIGDSTTDIQTAKNSGIRSVLIKTGFKGMDKKFNVKPNKIFSNLNKGVNYIINK